MTDPTEHAGNDPATGVAATKSQRQAQPASDVMTTGSDIIPYILPMFVYVGLTSLAFLAWYFRATWRDFRPWPGLVRIALGVLSGLLVCLAWVGLDGHYPGLPFYCSGGRSCCAGSSITTFSRCRSAR
jgi:hypothetical protein